jgi:hypothetical protein
MNTTTKGNSIEASRTTSPENAPRVLQYRLKVKHDTGTRTIVTAASSEIAARQIVCIAEGCPDSAIIQVRHHAQAWSKLKPAQITALSLLAYYCFNKYNSAGPNHEEAAIQTAEHACNLFKVPYIVQQTVKAGYIKGLPNLGRLSGGTYSQDYDFGND